MRFDEWMDAALYAPGTGFYESGGAAGGARGDFITSPEVGPLFGAVVARAVARWFGELDVVDGVVVEVGAGRGALAVSMLAAGLPDGARYVAVERSATLRAAASELLGDRAEVVATLDDVAPALGRAPGEPFDGVIVANELLDNLPFRIVERTDDGWAELHVDNDASAPTALLCETDAFSSVLAPQSRLGQRLPVLENAAAWVDGARRRLRRGRVLAFDYGVATTAELLDRQWLRTYSGHQRGDDPFALPAGHADVTTDIALDQLPEPAAVSTQAEWLRRHGVDDLVAEGRRIWAERAHIGDLEAIRARSRVNEAEALLDSDGLGAFLVAEWDPV